MSSKRERERGRTPPPDEGHKNPKVVEGVMHVVSSMPLLNKKRMFRLRGSTLECVSLESDLIIARFDMAECEVKTEKDTLVLQMPNAVPVILQPPAEDYDKWKVVLRQSRRDAGGQGSAQVKVEPERGRQAQIKSDDASSGADSKGPPPPSMANAESMLQQHSWDMEQRGAPPPRASAESLIQGASAGPMDAKQRALEHQRKAQEMAKKIAAERQQIQAKMGINPTAKPARRKYIAKKYIIAKQLREEMAREAKQKLVDRTKQEVEFRQQMMQQLQKDREESDKEMDEERKKRMALFAQAKDADEKARQAIMGPMGPMGMMGPMGPMGMMGPHGFMAKPAAPLAKPVLRPLPWAGELSKLEMSPWTLTHRPVNDLLSRFPKVNLAPDLMSIVCHYAGPDLRGVVQLDPLAETLVTELKKELVMPDTVIEPPKGKKFYVKVALMTGKFGSLKTHPANQIQFVLVNKPGHSDTLPEGLWSKKVDGGALKETAIRVVRDMFGVDISKCTIHRFMDFKYTTEEGVEVQSTVMLPELWKCPGIPLTLGKLVKEEEEEVKVTMAVDEPMTPEDIEAQRKGWRENIERMRAQGKVSKPGERELDRIERLEKLEEEIKKMEKSPPEVKSTKQVTKLVSQKKIVRKDVSKPVLISLHHLLELGQQNMDGPFTTPIFETKMFAHCFLEMIKLEMGAKIIEWLPKYHARVTEEIELHTNKRKRDAEQLQERETINRERQAKRQKLEAKKQAKGSMREADRLEKEQMDQERKGDVEEETEEMEEVEPDLPPVKLTTLKYELDEAACKPFAYFDASTGQPFGTMERVEFLNIFHRTAMRCQREVDALIQYTLPVPPNAHNVPDALFPYRSACSIQKEVDPTAEQGGDDAAKDGAAAEDGNA